ncbi:MAG: transcription termination factor Rho [Nocardioidaceae bacterium]|nr:transcription termination factor Rho [Nocardioidaceae bacterium]
MTDTTTLGDSADAAPASAPRRRAAGLSGKVLAELQQIAGELGISGTAKMRKGALIEAIKQAQGGGTAAPATTAPATTARKSASKAPAAATLPGTDTPAPDSAPAPEAVREPERQEPPRTEQPAEARADRASTRDRSVPDRAPQERDGGQDDGRNDARRSDGRADQGRKSADQPDRSAQDKQAARTDDKRGDDKRTDDKRGDDKAEAQKSGRNDRGSENRANENRGNENRGNENRANENRGNENRGNENRGNDDRGQDDGWDDEGGGRRRNRNRNRNRNRDRAGGPAGTASAGNGNGGGNDRGRDRGPESEPTVSEDDVLIPAAGILDILDNYAFVRTSGYLPGPNDVYVSLSMVRKWGLRRGDAVVGQVRQTREGERKEKFNPLVKIESVNGMSIDEARKRVEFSKLTPLYPSERLRLETEQTGMTGRIIDIVSPIGKGQRGLIVSPPKAGKTMVMQGIANAISVNNPECHLMIVLVDERPEEVTDFQRTVKGEVIASTFDRPATDHTTIAELAIERAKRLVELGHDVVVLLDGITRLGRAYNLSAPASGRILSGGVDSAALYPPKKFFGAARNIEDGGSLTILATALVETGSRMDEVIFEEFKGTGNMELRLRREFADKRIFPAIDVVGSGTRREELLMGKDELAVVWKLRRLLSSLEGQQGLELMIERLRKTQSNGEFLLQVQKTTPTSGAVADLD